MAKSEMKFIGVVILMMIIVGSTQADNNSPDLTGCEVKCGFKCIAYFYSKKNLTNVVSLVFENVIMKCPLMLSMIALLVAA